MCWDFFRAVFSIPEEAFPGGEEHNFFLLHYTSGLRHITSKREEDKELHSLEEESKTCCHWIKRWESLLLRVLWVFLCHLDHSLCVEQKQTSKLQINRRN